MFWTKVLADFPTDRALELLAAHGWHVAAVLASAVVGLGLAQWIASRRVRHDWRVLTPEHVTEADFLPTPVAAGIYRDAVGGYLFSPSRLTEIATRCPHIDARQVRSLLSIAVSLALDADGVPPLVLPLGEDDVVSREAA